MREWLGLISDPVITAIDAIALLVIVVGTAEVSVNVVRAAIKPLGEQEARRSGCATRAGLSQRSLFSLRPTLSKPLSPRAGRALAGSARSPSSEPFSTTSWSGTSRGNSARARPVPQRASLPATPALEDGEGLSRRLHKAPGWGNEASNRVDRNGGAGGAGCELGRDGRAGRPALDRAGRGCAPPLEHHGHRNCV